MVLVAAQANISVVSTKVVEHNRDCPSSANGYFSGKWLLSVFSKIFHYINSVFVS